MSVALKRLERAISDLPKGGMQTGSPKVRLDLADAERLILEYKALAADARRWQAVRDGSYELLHNLSTAPAQYREQIIDEVSKV